MYTEKFSEHKYLFVKNDKLLSDDIHTEKNLSLYKITDSYR